MKNDFDKELEEIFLDQFIHQSIDIQQSVKGLENNDKYEKALNTLFRIFHGLKANSGYFHYDELYSLVVEVEIVLNGLRDINPPIAANVLEWLQAVSEQYMVWVKDTQQNKKFSHINKNLLEKIEITQEDETDPIAILKQHKVYYFHNRSTVSPKMVSVLNQYTAEVVHIASMQEFKQALQNNDVRFCILDISSKLLEATKTFYKYAHPTAALIVFVGKVNASTRIKMKLQGIYHILEYPIRLNDLQREMATIVESHFTSRRFLIDNKKIENFVFELKAFPDSVKNIQRVCNDSDSSIKDLIKVVKQDPVISGIIFKEVKNPLYKLSDINTIDKAVTLLGKKHVYAIATKRVLQDLQLEDLDLYKISFDTFSDVATKRYMLMVKWYSKVSIAALEMLSTATVLSNVGQLLIAKEVKRIGKTDDFNSLMEKYSIEYAEQKIVNTTTVKVSSDIFRFWNLHADIIDSVRFSDNPSNAPMEIFDLALANYIVFRLIPLNGNIASVIPEKIKRMMFDNGLNIQALQNALDAVAELTQ